MWAGGQYLSSCAVDVVKKMLAAVRRLHDSFMLMMSAGLVFKKEMPGKESRVLGSLFASLSGLRKTWNSD